MDAMEQIKATFFQECEELLADLESGLLALEAGEGDAETINSVFRAVHSVKGGAGAFGLESLVRFAHVFETALDEMRSERLEASNDNIKVMLRAADVLADEVAAAKSGRTADPARAAALAADLTAMCGGAAEASPPPPAGEVSAQPTEGASGLDLGAVVDDGFDALGFVPQAFGGDLADAPDQPSAWIVRFKPGRDLYAKANDPIPLLRELQRLGHCEITLDASALPTLDALDAEEAYLEWTVRVEGDCHEADLREVFDFVDGDCDLSVEPEGAEPAAPADDLLAGPEPMGDDVDISALIAAANLPPQGGVPAKPGRGATSVGDSSAPTPEPLPVVDDIAAAALAELDAVPDEPEGLDVQALIEKAEAAAPQVAAAAAPALRAAPAEAAGPAAGQNSAGATIRVDLERVDRLIDLVGELVINQAMLAQRMGETTAQAGSAAVLVALEDLEQLTREIQDSVMAIRAQPVKSVFQRMPRLVREAAAATGKQVRLLTEGEATEVDKTVIERLTDPITHMIRNAVDHGLETPADRIAAGKPPEGTVKLSAAHRSGRILIEVTDDGRGINRARVRDIAVSKGLIDANAVLTDDEIDNLIFMPGFSTAETVTDLSGRGVGMDVVRRSIQALGGRISISSRPGEGSTFTMSLPLTLAVLDGMVVTAADQTLVAPLTTVIETLQPKPEDIRALGPTGSVLVVRNTHVPIVDVGVALGYRATAIEPSEGVALLVEAAGGGRAALLVEAIQGQRQVVIKSLEANFQQVEGIAAATILGDGRVALILDVDAVIDSRRRGSSAPLSAPSLKAAS
jgi:two-component system chemotaxis sensor kinase CheA